MKILRLAAIALLSLFGAQASAADKHCDFSKVLSAEPFQRYMSITPASSAAGWDHSYSHRVSDSITLSISSKRERSTKAMDPDLFQKHMAEATSEMADRFRRAGYTATETTRNQDGPPAWTTSFEHADLDFSAMVVIARPTRDCQFTAALQYPTKLAQSNAINTLKQDFQTLPSRLRTDELAPTLKELRSIPSGLIMFAVVGLIAATFSAIIALITHTMKWHRDIYLTLYQKIMVTTPVLIGTVFACVSIALTVLERANIENMELIVLAIVQIFLIMLWLVSLERYHSTTLFSFLSSGASVCIVYLALNWAWSSTPLIVWVISALISAAVASVCFQARKRSQEIEQKFVDADPAD